MKRHLIGVGGVGMSALATALTKLGYKVTGADRTLDAPNINFLQSLGVECFPDDGSGVDTSVDEVIISTAIEPSNPGLLKAKALGIRITHRAAALAEALSGHKLIAVAGTCGKSTVTAMLGHILAECGIDPFCVNGANVPGWTGSVRFGASSWAVAEVDESDKSLIAFKPYAAVITNASADHYSKEEMDDVFDQFISQVTGGVVIDGRKVVGEADVSVPGKHNRNNAFLALQMALALGCDESKARRALMSFGGVERRLQKVGPCVYDDYAHNPQKLEAMWGTLAQAHKGGVCVVWRPHGYQPLRKMLPELADVFTRMVRDVDKLLLLPVYDMGGTTDRSINSEMLAAQIPKSKVVLVDSIDSAYDWISKNIGSFEAFATCGARDIALPGLAKRIAALKS